MTKQELKRDITSAVGNSMPTISDIARYMGVGRDTAREIVDGLEYLESGRAKRFWVGDVADRIMSMRRA